MQAPICIPLYLLNYRILLFFFVCLFSVFGIMYIAPCVKRRRMSRILVFNDASAVFQRSCKMYPLYRNLQHVVYKDWMGGTQWHSTDIETKIKRSSNVYSVLQQFDRKRKTKKGALIYVLAIVFSLLNMESLWLNTSWEGRGVLFNTNAVFWWKEEMKKGVHNTAKCREQAEATPHHTAADDH